MVFFWGQIIQNGAQFSKKKKKEEDKQILNEIYIYREKWYLTSISSKMTTDYFQWNNTLYLMCGRFGCDGGPKLYYSCNDCHKHFDSN